MSAIRETTGEQYDYDENLMDSAPGIAETHEGQLDSNLAPYIEEGEECFQGDEVDAASEETGELYYDEEGNECYRRVEANLEDENGPVDQAEQSPDSIIDPAYYENGA